MAMNHGGTHSLKESSRDDYGDAADGSPTVTLHLKLREFINPVVRDGLVVGKKAPIDAATLKRALGLLVNIPFEQVSLEDDVVSDVLIRSSLLKRIARDRLIRMVIRSVKPSMEASEIIQMDIHMTTTFQTEG